MKKFMQKTGKTIADAFKKIQYNSPVILSFALISFGAYLLSLLTADADGGTALSWTNLTFFSVYRSSLTDPFSYVRAVGHVFGHANIDHYLGNFMLILLTGPMLEEKYGSRRLALMMAFTALVTGLIHILLFPGAALMGASGIVFMFILLSSFVNLKKGRIPLTLLLCIVVFIGREILSGMFNQGNISYLTHIIGGLCGAAFGYFINKDKFTKTEEADA